MPKIQPRQTAADILEPSYLAFQVTLPLRKDMRGGKGKTNKKK